MEISDDLGKSWISMPLFHYDVHVHVVLLLWDVVIGGVKWP